MTALGVAALLLLGSIGFLAAAKAPLIWPEERRPLWRTIAYGAVGIALVVAAVVLLGVPGS